MTSTPTREEKRDWRESSVDEILPLPVKVEMWAMNLVDALEADYKRSYPDSHNDKKFEVKVGRKYLKINQYDLSPNGERWSGGVHAFIDKNTGQVYKPASWKGPAKQVRYDLRIINERNACFQSADWAGGYLYLK